MYFHFAKLLAIQYIFLCKSVIGKPDQFETRARIDPLSIHQDGDTLSGLLGELPYVEVFKPVEATFKDQLILNVEEVVLVYVDVQNDFTDYHQTASSGYKPTLAVPGSKAAIKVMNAIRLAGDFSGGSGHTESRFSGIYRSEDYHVPGSLTFATSHCWLDSEGKRYTANYKGASQNITECTRYKFNLISDADSADMLSQAKVSKRDILVWPPHCVVGTYGQRSHDDLRKSKSDRVILKGVYKYRESLTAVVESYVKGETIDETQADGKMIQRELINMKLDLAEKCPNAKYVIVMGFEYMNCVGETARSLASILDDKKNKKYKVIIPTNAVGYFAPPIDSKRRSITDELKKLGVEFVDSKSLSFKFGASTNTVDI